jgi:histidine ammonia-lyase
MGDRITGGFTYAIRRAQALPSELARVTARGFERVEKRLDIIEDDVADLKKDTGHIKSRLKIADEIEGSDVSVWDDHEKRLRKLESKAGIMPLD